MAGSSTSDLAERTPLNVSANHEAFDDSERQISDALGSEAT